MRGLIVAVQFLSRLPVPALEAVREGDMARAAAWLPLVGALVGTVVAAAVALGAAVSPLVGAGLGIAAWAWVTGALHLDGLGDAADGLAAAHGDPERFLKVAKDPATGAFGVVAIVVVMVLKLVGLGELARQTVGEIIAVIVLAAAWARWCALLMAARVRPLGAGLGGALQSGARLPAVLGWAVLLAALSLLVQPLLVVALGFGWAACSFWERRVRGVSGDCHGATIETVEAVVVLLAVAGQALGITGGWRLLVGVVG